MLMSFPYSSVRLATVSSFLPSFLRSQLNCSRHSASSCVQESRRKRKNEDRLQTLGFRPRERTSERLPSRSPSDPAGMQGHKIRSLVWGENGQSHIKLCCFSFFFLPTVASLLHFFFCLYHLSKGHSSRSVESARPDSPPTHPAAECLRSASLRSQNPAGQSHPAFPANKKHEFA